MRQIKKYITLIILLLTILSFVIPSTMSEDSSTLVTGMLNNTFYVGGSGPKNYSHIQDAINDSTNGDTVVVYCGTYYENLVIDKAITVIGEEKNNTIIDGGGNEVVKIYSNKVKLTGFTIKNCTYYAGILLWYVSYCNISDNIIINNFQGLWLSESHYNTFYDNYIDDKSVLDFSSYNIISENIFNCTIQIQGSTQNTLINNFVNSSIKIVGSYENYIIDNICKEVALGDSSYNLVSGNFVFSTEPPPRYPSP